MSRARVVVLSSTFPQYDDDPRGQFIARYWQKRARDENLEVHVLAPTTYWTQPLQLEGLFVRRFSYAPTRLSSLTGRFGILENCKEAPWRALLLPAFYRAQKRALQDAIAKLSPQRLVGHMFLPCALAIADAARKSNASYELFGHGTDVDLSLKLPSPWHGEMRRALEGADVVCFPSGEKRVRACQRFGLDLQDARYRVETCRDSVVKPEAALDGPPRSHVLFLGRLIAQKCVEDLLYAASQIADFPPIDIAGDGPQLDKLKRLAAKLRLQTTFHGFVEGDAREQLFARARVLCVPSRARLGLSEGAPLVILEARARGVPVVARPEGGIAEICANDAGCLVVEDGSIASLRRGLLTTLGL